MAQHDCMFGVRQVKQPGVTSDEIRVMLEQGAEEGVFERAEHEMVTNVLNHDERQVGAVITPGPMSCSWT